MSRVIIVSRTRMAGDCVCIGGIDIDNHRSVRLLDASGHHEYANLCPYQIWDIWDIDYHMSHKRPSPHTEDANVTRRDKIRTANPSDLPVERLASFLERSGIPMFRGSLFKVFEGKLKRTDYDKLFISKEDVPAYSTCFWVNDRRLIGYNNERGRRQYRYNDMSNMYGYTISYVGAAEPPSNIEAGSLIRLSLAHWWSPDDSNDEERCYLQLSGCLIQGKADEPAAAPEEIETQSGKVENPISDGRNLIVKDNEWFDEYEQELDKLLLEKANIEEKIKELRSHIKQQMEERQMERIATEKFSISYSPARTTLQFNSKAFKQENEELYASYCIPKQKDAAIVIRKLRQE